ncbi:hypothetical protein RHMOL_Rhmol12G0082300 [Rhododendron molle]|uniref:Uncharacterized protein n=1 Tax=Rhododendron molle TaxID=49168 RepID=A0ACC0LFJ2_RHOML|nr:hypothetical protein RHMOL_Rhmol12G0082300 [Rhododendron molle]
MSLGAAPVALADPNPIYPSGRTAADLASSNGHKGIAGYLAESALSSHLTTLQLKDGCCSHSSSLQSAVNPKKAAQRVHVRGHQMRKNYRKITWSVGIVETEHQNDLNLADAELEDAKCLKEMMEQEIKGYEGELAMNEASIQTLEARVSLIQEEISVARFDLEALKNEEGDLRYRCIASFWLNLVM